MEAILGNLIVEVTFTKRKTNGFDDCRFACAVIANQNISDLIELHVKGFDPFEIPYNKPFNHLKP